MQVQNVPKTKEAKKNIFSSHLQFNFPSLHFFLLCHILITSKISLIFFFLHFISSFLPIWDFPLPKIILYFFGRQTQSQVESWQFQQKRTCRKENHSLCNIQSQYACSGITGDIFNLSVSDWHLDFRSTHLLSNILLSLYLLQYLVTFCVSLFTAQCSNW